ncbi:hypothetical protein A2159_02830 [Candidatus Woesebacteria bacterium RBG_13_34_9]|uniref:N-acetyltransferase domain-containing protein n=1 Tax=Candidatus Woesebacteria bacterium RBG_13_34_9 TaxID=1802477 RepID=A0A1F7X1V9_9BACT|nr:MAG: hypothetical protein A2159_02830 [Candidatus Woesebacteria bacterium RBG_13_34_9]
MKRLPNQENVQIVAFQPQYTEEVKQVVFSGMRELRCGYDPLTDLRNEDLEKIEKIYSGKGKFWIALHHQKVVGTVALLEYNSEIAFLKRLFLMKVYRKKGIGWKLLKTALDYGKKQGFRKIQLITSIYAKDAQNLFERNGFIKADKTFDFDEALIEYILKY